MKKLLVYYNFVIVSLIVIAGMLTAQNPTQLAVASAFFPLLFYFGVKIYPRKSKAIKAPEEVEVVVLQSKKEPEVEKLKKEGVDTDRRAFLKLIGTAGLTLFLFSLFTKRAEAAFFGSVPGPGTVSIKDTAGNKIDPAEKHPTDGYNITDLDDSSPAYYGYMNKAGNWYIMKEDSSGAYRYTKGTSSYSSNWTGRAGLSYDYFDNVF